MALPESFHSTRAFAVGERDSLRLRRPFVVLVLMLLLAVSASAGAGLVGIGYLDRALREVAEHDAQCLVTVTHIRRLFRSEVVLTHDMDQAREPAQREAQTARLESLRQERAVLLDRLRTLGIADEEHALRDLELDHETMVRQGIGAAMKWENAVAHILNATQQRLTRAATEAERKSRSAKVQLLMVSGLAFAIAFALGAIVLRRVRRTSDALRESEAHFRTVVQAAPSLLTILSPELELRYLPPRGPAFLGMSSQEIATDPLGWVVVEDRDLLKTQIAETASGAAQAAVVRLRAKRSDGVEWYASTSAAALFDVHRNVTGIILQILDITSRVKAERAQAELEEQLRHAQKMESVGRLAGGIAHDFNNLLTAIKGYATLLQQDPNGSDTPEFVESILAATDRAADLTRQLLTFSRKHVISPVPTNLGELLRGLEKLLVPVVGEDVRLEIKVEDDLGLCMVDKNQVEQAVMNLAINARHAMPNGGRLLIEAKNAELDEGYTAKHPGVTPGPYIAVSVSDTGMGMSKEVQARAFEPFFTTKPVGQGTGLGLSVVHGTVHQHGGTIDLYSELGLGTTFRLYWPRIESVAPADDIAAPSRARPGGNELVLLVEDEFLVRNFTAKALSRLGYRVLVADTAHEALQLMDGAHETPGLLFTDVILPDKNGPELAKELCGRFPNLPVLFASGYSGKLMTERGNLPAGVHYLQKPYDLGTLSRRVREAIDRGAPSNNAQVRVAVD